VKVTTVARDKDNPVVAVTNIILEYAILNNALAVTMDKDNPVQQHVFNTP